MTEHVRADRCSTQEVKIILHGTLANQLQFHGLAFVPVTTACCITDFRRMEDRDASPCACHQT